ncbi:MAG: hypothetical protein AVDCRST_MAG38-2068, partial [uncultured Solirubrobacteraceae bacterium]
CPCTASSTSIRREPRRRWPSASTIARTLRASLAKPRLHARRGAWSFPDPTSFPTASASFPPANARPSA